MKGAGIQARNKKTHAQKGALAGCRSLTITLDHLPQPELSPNSRLHWAVKARAVRSAKEEIGWLAKVAGWSSDDKPMQKAKISYEFHLKDKRHRDLDNLMASCKSLVDGLVDVGVLLYDDSKHLEIGSVKVVQDDKEQTVIRVLEVL